MIMNELAEEDIEMVGLEERPFRDKDTPTQDSNDSEDDEDDLGDDGSRALLGPQEWARDHPPSLSSIRKYWSQIKNIVIESAPTLLLTTISLLFTGELLDQVSRWRAMREVDQLIMIIPVVLNLKGNLEMNLSARLGTAANVGELDEPEARRSMIIGNLTLLQVQATAVSFIAACVALVLGLFVPRVRPPSSQPSSSSNSTTILPSNNSTISPTHQLFTSIVLSPRRPLPILPNDGSRKSGLYTIIMVTSTTMAAACLSGIILGSFMCTLIVICRRFGRDPDNIAPPIASCLGDLVTLCLVGLVSTLLIRVINTPIPAILGILVVISAISCLIFTLRNPYVRPLLKQGWSPLLAAMVISSGTGIILDMFVSRYEGFALLAVVISGLPGSVGSIFVSRLSTALHAAALSIGPTTSRSAAVSNASGPSPRTVMITLLVETLPVEIIFLAILRGLGWLHLPFLFVAMSVVFFCCAVLASLIIAQLLTNFLWSKQRDPDLYALPIHSALMDLIGQLLLVICFEIVSLMGARVKMKA